MTRTFRDYPRPFRRNTIGLAWTTVLLFICCAGNSTGWSAESLQVALIAEERANDNNWAKLETTLAQTFGFVFTRSPATRTPNRSPVEGLRNADAAIVHRGPGALPPDDAALLRSFLSAGKPLVIIAGAPDAWPSEPRFTEDILGAKPGAVFANGAPLTIINLFPHPILTGITRLETDQAIPLFTQLSDDAQMIMEGTVGEATAPLAWVRHSAIRRLAHFVMSDPQLINDPAYQRIIGQAVLWAARRAIPGAHAAVQRTFMPDAYPGAIAITLPNGPGICLDPVRGGINYIWEGDFVDLRPRWITKQGEPARIFGEIFYREKEWQPLRGGSPNGESDFRFRGYTLRDGFPEFHYQIGGRDVYESFAPGHDANSLLRRFRVAAGATPLWFTFEPQTSAEVVVSGLERDGQVGVYKSKGAGEFTIEIRRKAVLAP